MKKLLLYLLLPIIFFSCKSIPKDVAYFQDIDKYKEQLSSLTPDNLEYTIKSGDQLIITVTSPTIHQEVVAQYNLPAFQYSPLGEISKSGETSIKPSTNIQTYFVDLEGYINYPRLGKIKLAGLKKSEAIQYLTKQIILNDAELKDPIVNIQNASFAVSVIGEVNAPSYVKVENERVTIMDAIANAEGMTIYGDRKNILLIRNNNGAIETAHIDLTSSNVFFSPYYYLQQGDLVIVQPNDAQKRASKYGEAEQYRLSIYSLVFSLLSVAASTVVAIISINK